MNGVEKGTSFLLVRQTGPVQWGASKNEEQLLALRRCARRWRYGANSHRQTAGRNGHGVGAGVGVLFPRRMIQSEERTDG